MLEVVANIMKDEADEKVVHSKQFLKTQLPL